MALPLQTQVRVDGRWVTRTIDTHTLLQHHNRQDESAEETVMNLQTPPIYGLLTQTIVPSPLVHWILPVRLRGPHYNDVAFIGDTFVEIRELKAGPHLYDVVRKDDFGFRIRNASVIGSLNHHDKQKFDTSEDHVKQELDDDVHMADSFPAKHSQQHEPTELPPQILVLVLDTGISGETVFLFLTQSDDGSWKFVSSQRRLSKTMDKLQAGMHLAVDPSSRYIAIGGSEQVLTICALQSSKELNKQYIKKEKLCYVESEKVHQFHGTIIKMAFLYPSSGDPDNIILLLIMSKNGRIRMELFQWGAGADLKTLRLKNQNKKGHGHAITEMPLLLIPIRFRTAFLLVNQRSIEVYNGILHGAPECMVVDQVPMAPTEFYQGVGVPLWTAWARPDRLPHYTPEHDDIYLAREDGAICLLEIKRDEVDFAAMDIGCLLCNIGLAFTSLDYADLDTRKSGDLLVSGGDSSIGGTYLILPKDIPHIKEYIQNWSPAIDLATLSKDNPDLDSRAGDFVPEPESIFICSGKGPQSAITELRHGIEAKIALEFGYSSEVMKAWVLPSCVEGEGIEDGYLLLLALANGSAVVHISSDLMAATELDSTTTQLDLNCRTIVAASNRDYAIQVTEQSIIILNAGHRTIISGLPLLGGSTHPSAVINDAVVYEDSVLFTAHFEDQRVLRRITFDHTTSPSTVAIYWTISTWSSMIQITCFTMTTAWDTEVFILGILDEENVITVELRDHRDHLYEIQVPTDYNGNSDRLEALSSIVVANKSSDHLVLLCGTLNGFILLLDVDKDRSNDAWIVQRSHCKKIGATPVMLTRDDKAGSTDSFFAICDSKVLSLTLDNDFPLMVQHIRRGFKQVGLERVWALDSMDPAMQQPGFNYISRFEPQLPPGTDNRILLVSNEQLYLAELGTQRKIIPRRISLKGTPSRFIYSRTLDVFVVAASKDGKSTLYFVDPKTGDDLSLPTIKKRSTSSGDVDFIKGLGKIDDKIFCIYEWHFTKDRYNYYYLVVCTSRGKVLVISTEKDRSPPASSSGRERIRYWTMHTTDCDGPVYSVTGDSMGLYYCVGSMLHYEVLNPIEKKFVHVAAKQMKSDVISLSYHKDEIYALTSHDSLQIVQVIRGRSHPTLSPEFFDQLARETLHTHTIGIGDKIHLVSDRGKCVAGLWAGDMVVNTLEAVFEAHLPSSIVRFRSASCRPVWDDTWKAYSRAETLGIVVNDRELSETLGLGIDGSISHFTLLHEKAWRFLKFLVNLAKQSGMSKSIWDPNLIDVGPKDGPIRAPRMMQVDGDTLRWILEGRNLESLFYCGRPELMEGKEDIFARFCELLSLMHDGEDMEGSIDDPNFCFRQAYEDLAVFLRPVL